MKFYCRRTSLKYYEKPALVPNLLNITFFLITVYRQKTPVYLHCPINNLNPVSIGFTSIYFWVQLNCMRDYKIYEGDFKQFREHRQRSRVFFGIALAITGILLMLRTLRILRCFTLEESWPAILIILGVLIGIKNNFRNNAWWILIIIGVTRIVPEFPFLGHSSTEFVWPAVIIVAGIAIAFRPKQRYCYAGNAMKSSVTSDSNLNIDATFGGRKEVVTSKDFRGGSVTVTFAGCELNLTQADFTSNSVVVDCRVSFGGVEIIVPSHWEVQNEISPSFGSVEDERTIQTGTTIENKKILILRGSCSFGSIEIKSY